MFDGIIYISDYEATIKLKDSENITINLINLHLVFDDGDKKILGEVKDVNNGTITVNFLGEFIGNKFVSGTIKKPKLDTKIRGINAEEFGLVIGSERPGYIALGKTPFYDGMSVYLDINRFFGNHFAFIGNAGSGKSYAICSLIQNLFTNNNLDLSKSNFVIFDSTGEYRSAFDELNTSNSNYNYRFISSNEKNNSEKLRIPIYLLNEYDLALLLKVSEYSQLSIIEKMRKYAIAFSKTDEESNNYKNYLIAKAIKNILMSDDSASHKKSEVFSILSNFATPKFNIAVTIQGSGYSKQFRECFIIENGQFTDINLINEYISSFLDSKYESYVVNGEAFYSLTSLKKAFDFLLISDGLLKNDNTYCDAVLLKAKLDKLLNSEYVKYFDVKERMSCADFLKSLIAVDDKKYQILNVSFDAVSENLAKTFIEIISRIVFEYCKELDENGKPLFHIIVDDAHRYVKNENNEILKDYSVFENISKDGRKFGVMLGIVGQSSTELSKYVVSQCSNFLLFRNNHFDEINYIKKLASAVNANCLERITTLQVGNCLCFGTAFRIPMLVKIDKPSPLPFVEGINIVSYWNGGNDVDNENSSDTLSSSNDFSLLQPIQNDLVVDSNGIIGSDDSMITNSFAGILGDSQESTSSNDVIGDVPLMDEQTIILGDDSINATLESENQVLSVSEDSNVIDGDDSSSVIDTNVESTSDVLIPVETNGEEVIVSNESVSQEKEEEDLTTQVNDESSTKESSNTQISENNKSNDGTNEKSEKDGNDNSSDEAMLIIPTGVGQSDDNEKSNSNLSDLLVISSGDTNENNNSNSNSTENSNIGESLTIPKAEPIENNNVSSTLALPSSVGDESADNSISQPSIPLVSFGNQTINQENNTSSSNYNLQSSENSSNSGGGVPSLITFNNGNMALPINDLGGNNNSNNSYMGGLIDFVSNNTNNANISNSSNSANVGNTQEYTSSNVSVPMGVPSGINSGISNNSGENKKQFVDTFNIEDLPDVNLGKGVSENAGFLNLSGATIVNADGPGNNSAILNLPQVPSNLTLAGGMNDTSGEALSFDNNSSLVSFLEKM